MKIERRQAAEQWLLTQTKEWLNRQPRREGIHVSDLLYPRKAYWKRLDPKPMTDDEAGFFIAGRGHHEIIEAIIHASPSVTHVRELAFAAGLVEGEGTFGVTSGDNPTTYIAVTNTKRSLLYWLKQNFQGEVSADKRPADRPEWTPCFTWKLCGEAAGNFARDISPYILSKRPQLTQWLGLRAITDSWTRRKEVPAEMLHQKQTLANALRAARQEDAPSDAPWPQAQADVGSHSWHGIWYSPDALTPHPLEIKTSRSQYGPKAETERSYRVEYEHYLKQLTAYMAIREDPEGDLLVFYLTLKDRETNRTTPRPRWYHVTLSQQELGERQAELLAQKHDLEAALKRKNPTLLSPCPEWLCRGCIWRDKCGCGATTEKRRMKL